MPRNAIIVTEENIGDASPFVNNEREREREGIKQWKLAVIMIEKVFHVICLPGRGVSLLCFCFLFLPPLPCGIEMAE